MARPQHRPHLPVLAHRPQVGADVVGHPGGVAGVGEHAEGGHQVAERHQVHAELPGVVRGQPGRGQAVGVALDGARWSR